MAVNRCAAVFLLLGFSASAEAAEPNPAYVGTWAVNPGQCGKPQEQQDAPMLVGRNRFDQHEAHCEFPAVRSSENRWTADARCIVEGNRQRMRLTLSVREDRLTIDFGDGVSTAYRRCPNKAAAASAQPATDPAATIAGLYERYRREADPKMPKGIFTARLQSLFEADRKRTAKGDIGRLDFDPFVNGQDWELSDLRVGELSREDGRARVRATFRNLGTPQEIIFDLTGGPERWLIDDVTSLKEARWTLSKILRGAPDAFPREGKSR